MSANSCFLPVLLTELLTRSHTHLVVCCFYDMLVELSSCNRNHMAHRCWSTSPGTSLEKVPYPSSNHKARLGHSCSVLSTLQLIFYLPPHRQSNTSPPFKSFS